MMGVCASCQFWQPPAEGNPNPMGQCRRYPPKPFMILAQAPGTGRIAQPGQMQQVSAMPMFPSAWPPSPADGWCGEYEQKKLESGAGE